MVRTSATNTGDTNPTPFTPFDWDTDAGGSDDWVLSDTAEEPATDLNDTSECEAVVVDEEPARDTIPSPPPEAGAEVTQLTIPAPPPLGDFDCS